MTGYVGGRGYSLGGLPPEAVVSVASAMFGIKNVGADELAKMIREMSPTMRKAAARLNASKAAQALHRAQMQNRNSKKRDQDGDDGSQEWLDREAEKKASQFRGAMVMMSRRYRDDELLASYCRKIRLPV